MIIFDVDGTVCNSCQEITYEMEQLLKSIPDEIVFLSGTDAQELYRMLPGFEDYYILSNSGAECWYKLQRVYANPILKNTREIISCLESFVEYPNADILNRGSQITWSLIGRFANHTTKKEFDPSGELRQRLVDRLQKQFPTLSIRHGGTSSIDIGGVDKLDGLIRFLAYRKIRPEQIVYVGDNFNGNDKPLLGFVPCVHVSSPEQLRDYLKTTYKIEG